VKRKKTATLPSFSTTGPFSAFPLFLSPHSPPFACLRNVHPNFCSAPVRPTTPKFPRSVCTRDVGRNSIQCSRCKRWVQNAPYPGSLNSSIFFVWVDLVIRCSVQFFEPVHSVIIESRQTKCPIWRVVQRAGSYYVIGRLLLCSASAVRRGHQAPFVYC